MAKEKTSKKVQLQAEKRKVFGRKVKQLRQKEILPANIYGKKVKSLAVQVDLKSFLSVFKEAGETSLVEVKVKGESKARPTLIHNVQLDPVEDQPLHADFYQVDLKQKVTTEIPVETVGESPAVKEKSGVLFQPLTEVEVEALPTELPDKFEVNLGDLKEIGDMVSVGDLKAPKGVEILTAKKEILAKVEAPEEEEKVKPEVEAVEGEAPAEEGDEGVPAEKQKGQEPGGVTPTEKPAKEGETEKSAEVKVEKKKEGK